MEHGRQDRQSCQSFKRNLTPQSFQLNSGSLRNVNQRRHVKLSDIGNFQPKPRPEEAMADTRHENKPSHKAEESFRQTGEQAAEQTA
jgi:hypothetical protein